MESTHRSQRFDPVVNSSWKYLVAAIVAAMCLAADAPTAPPPTTAPATQPSAASPGPVDDRVSYAVGFTFGRRIHDRLAEDDRSANSDAIMKGVLDGLDGKDPAFPRAEVETAFAKVQMYAMAKQAQKAYDTDPAFRKLADDNMTHSKAMLDQNAEMPDVEVLPSGVQIQVVKAAKGRVIGNAKFVTANFDVYLADGALVRASEPGKPQKVATADVLPALLDATRGMKVGETWRIIVPPNRAYGLPGKPPLIGPNQALRYDVELIAAE